MVQHRRAGLCGGATPTFRPDVRALEQQMGLPLLCGGLPRRQRDLRGCSHFDSFHHRTDDTGRRAGWCIWGHIHTDRADHASEDTEPLRWLVRCRLCHCCCRRAGHRLADPFARVGGVTDAPACFRWCIHVKSLVEMVLLLWVITPSTHGSRDAWPGTNMTS